MGRWFRIPKEGASQPENGTYSDWKPILREEGRCQCVYCGIHESAFGGARLAHVEHFRPKSTFPSLVNDIKNLYYACAICNAFKSDDWPDEPSLAQSTYVDPSVVDYSTIFTVSEDWLLCGTTVASRYMVERIYLNRAQLILERREASVLARANELCERASQLLTVVANARPVEVAGVAQALASLNKSLVSLREATQYEPDDVKRRSH